MGPTILILPSVLRRIFAEAGRRPRRRLDLVRSTRSGAASSTTARCSTWSRDADGMAAGLDALCARRRLRRLPGLHGPVASACTHLASATSSGARSARCATCSTSTASFRPATLGDVLATAPGRTWRHRAAPRRRRARGADDRPLHAIRRLGPGWLAGGALRNRAHANRRRRLVSARRHPGRAEALENSQRELGVEIHTGHGRRRILTRKASGWPVSRRMMARRSRSPQSSQTADAVRTHRELIGGEVGAQFDKRAAYEPACSGRRPLPRLERALRAPAHHDFVFWRDPQEEFDWIYSKGEPAPDPTCYLCAPAATEPRWRRPAARRSTCWSTRLTCVRITTGRGCCRRYRQVIIDKLKRTAGLRTSRSDRVRAALTPQDIHDRYHVLNGAIYGLASHGRFLGAFKPGNRSPDVAASTSPAAPRIPDRACRWC